MAADYGGDPCTTNNKMELTAAIRGLQALSTMYVPRRELVELVADSQYTLGMASGRMSPGMGKDGRPTNGELVARLQKLAQEWLGKAPDGRPLTRWVPGHAGDTWNERADSLAKRGKRESTPA